MATKDFCTVLSDYRRELSSVRTLLESLRAVRTAEGGVEEQIFDTFTALEVAQFHLAVAFASSSLFFTYLKTQGYDVKAHPVSQDLLRVQQYMKKVAGIIEKGDPPKRSIVVDAAAAKRVVAFHTKTQTQGTGCGSAGETREPPDFGSPEERAASEKKSRLSSDSPGKDVAGPPTSRQASGNKSGSRPPGVHTLEVAGENVSTFCQDEAAPNSSSSQLRYSTDGRHADAERERGLEGKRLKRSKAQSERKGNSKIEGCQGDARAKRKKP
uniref:Nuclear nucleic acid-binding protein C1D n=1 Tax=Toxoplasma gondii COUG TaxID=1074873 RepID=A0A2G8XMG6_TOXGO|nr:Sas10/Utp3/C1D family protein [Toxoplasma gondii COUG]